MKLENTKIVQAFLKAFADGEAPAEATKVEVPLEDGTTLIVDKLEKDGVAMIGTDLAAPADYKGKDGSIITVGENGLITGVVLADAAMADKPKEDKPADDKGATASAPVEKTASAFKQFNIKEFYACATGKDGSNLFTPAETFTIGAAVFTQTPDPNNAYAYVSTPAAEDITLSDGTLFSITDGKITAISNTEEVGEVETVVEVGMSEFSERLEVLEKALFRLAEENKKFSETNKDELEKIKKDVKLFSDKPTTVTETEIVDVKKKTTNMSNIGINKNAFRS